MYVKLVMLNKKETNAKIEKITASNKHIYYKPDVARFGNVSVRNP